MDKKKRMQELVELLNRAGKAYYQESREIMSNFEYDALYDELKGLEEELGIKSQATDFTFIGTFHNCYDEVFHQAEFKNREVSFVHVYSKPVDEKKLVLQEEEVSAASWFDLDEVWEKALAKDPAFCTPVGGLKLLREYLQKL